MKGGGAASYKHSCLWPVHPITPQRGLGGAEPAEWYPVTQATHMVPPNIWARTTQLFKTHYGHS